MKKRIDYRFVLLALAWMAIIFWFSNQSTLFYLPKNWLDVIFKKTSHAAAYGVLWILWWLATGRRTRLSLLITVLYAFSDEFHQTFIPGRHGQFFDVGVDTLGALLTMGLMHSSWGRVLLARLRPST